MRDEDRIAQESNEMLLRRFVSAVGYDYIEHHKKHTAQIHPDFSEDTVALWTEIESRLKAPTVLQFDAETAIKSLKSFIERQEEIIQSGASDTTSYHVGLQSGFNSAIAVIRNCMRKGETDACR